MNASGVPGNGPASAAGTCPAAELLFCDGQLAAVIKRGGVLSEHGTEKAPGMPERVARALGRAPEEVFPVHRLDREAAGGMVYALTERAAAALSRSIQAGDFQKTYLCLCEGAPQEKSGRWTDLLYHDPVKNRSYAVKRKRRGVREAVLEYETLDTVTLLEEGKTVSLLRIRLLTGRTHQIRVQCASRGMPLVGDRKYGSACPGPLELWCFSLSFPHPASGKRMDFPFPPDRGRLAEVYFKKA